MISRFELFVENTIIVISHFKVNRNVSISLYVWLVRTRSDYLCIVDSGANMLIAHSFLALAPGKLPNIYSYTYLSPECGPS